MKRKIDWRSISLIGIGVTIGIILEMIVVQLTLLS
jgi:hypothetical protein